MRKSRMMRKIAVFVFALAVSFGVSVSVYCAEVTPRDISENLIREEWSHLNGVYEAGGFKEYMDTAQTTNLTDAVSTGYVLTIAGVVKSFSNMISPQNQEQFQIPQTIVENGGENNFQASTINGHYSILSGTSIYGEDRGELLLVPLIAYADQDRDLVFIMMANNQTGHKIQLNGIDDIVMVQDNETIASGESQPFDTPMIYSKRSERKEGQRIYINKGVQDGYPNASFLKVTFEPGTYKDGLDITELDNVVVMYAPNYDILD